MTVTNANIADVAREANVAASTVSRCLSGYPHVAPDTRQRVLDACRKLNYQPNPNIQDLALYGRKNHTRSLAFVLGTRPFSQPQYAEIIDPLFSAVNRRQYHMTLLRVGGDEDCAFTLPAQLRDKRVDGVLLTGLFNRSLLDVFDKRELPCVVMGNYESSLLRGTACVRRDEDADYRELMALFRAHGVVRPGLALPNDQTFSNREALRLYRQFLAEAGFDDAPDRFWVGHDDGEELCALLRGVFQRETLPFDALYCPIAQFGYEVDRLSALRRGFAGAPLPIYATRHATLPFQRPVNMHLVGNGFDNVVEAAVSLLIDLIEGRGKNCTMIV